MNSNHDCTMAGLNPGHFWGGISAPGKSFGNLIKLFWQINQDFGNLIKFLARYSRCITTKVSTQDTRRLKARNS